MGSEKLFLASKKILWLFKRIIYRCLKKHKICPKCLWEIQKKIGKEMKFNVINVIIVVKISIPKKTERLENSLFKDYVYHRQIYT